MRLSTAMLFLKSAAVAVLTLAAAAGLPARAQDRGVEYVPRDGMVDAIADYAAADGCRTQRQIFGAAFDATCKAPDTDGTERMKMLVLLDRLSDDALVQLCRRNKITDCEKPREVSKGRAILTFESEFGIEFNSPHAALSPDGRLLLLDNLNSPLGEARLLDTAGGKLLDPPLYAGPLLRDAVWSPDGKYIALLERKRASPEPDLPVGIVRLYAVSTRREAARISAAEAGCEAGLAPGLAFTADSRSVWVPCSSANRVAKAVRLKIPRLEVEESFLPAFPVSAWSESFWEEGILRHRDDLIVTARFRNPASHLRTAVQSFSLRTREPLYPPLYVGGARLAADLAGVWVGNELWSTASGQRVTTDARAAGCCLGDPNRLPQLGMHVEVRAEPKSQHSKIWVIDSASGATVQQLGPIPKAIKALVAPNGAKVAILGFHGIRFYRVSP